MFLPANSIICQDHLGGTLTDPHKLWSWLVRVPDLLIQGSLSAGSFQFRICQMDGWIGGKVQLPLLTSHPLRTVVRFRWNEGSSAKSRTPRTSVRALPSGHLLELRDLTTDLGICSYFIEFKNTRATKKLNLILTLGLNSELSNPTNLSPKRYLSEYTPVYTVVSFPGLQADLQWPISPPAGPQRLSKCQKEVRMVRTTASKAMGRHRFSF